jgi:hypothetical protein
MFRCFTKICRHSDPSLNRVKMTGALHEDLRTSMTYVPDWSLHLRECVYTVNYEARLKKQLSIEHRV